MFYIIYDIIFYCLIVLLCQNFTYWFSFIYVYIIYRYLGGNQLTSPLPSEIGKLTNLQRLLVKNIKK